ncbi:MAG: hypothetical protein RIC12_01285 [Pirellulales bacterium]
MSDPTPLDTIGQSGVFHAFEHEDGWNAALANQIADITTNRQFGSTDGMLDMLEKTELASLPRLAHVEQLVVYRVQKTIHQDTAWLTAHFSTSEFRLPFMTMMR